MRTENKIKNTFFPAPFFPSSTSVSILLPLPLSPQEAQGTGAAVSSKCFFSAAPSSLSFFPEPAWGSSCPPPPPLKTWPHKPNTQIQLVSVSNLQNLHWSCQSSLLKLVEAINGHVRTQQPSCTDLVRPELCLQLHRYRWWQVPWSLHCSCVSLVVEGSLPQAASVPGALASISVLGANVIPDKQSCASQSQAGTGTVAKLWFFFPNKAGGELIYHSNCWALWVEPVSVWRGTKVCRWNASSSLAVLKGLKNFSVFVPACVKIPA